MVQPKNAWYYVCPPLETLRPTLQLISLMSIGEVQTRTS